MSIVEPRRENLPVAKIRNAGRDLPLQEFLREVVEVLCGTREQGFRYEKQLRLCQFKLWLLGYGVHWRALRQGGMIYAAAMISKKMRLLSKKRPDDLQGALLQRTLNDPSYRHLFDSVFLHPHTLYDLSECSSFETVRDYVTAHKRHVRDLNELTHWRLRIASTRGLTTALNKAYNAYEAVRVWENEENVRRGIKRDEEAQKLSSATLKGLHEKLESREPFLFAAFRYFPEIAKISPNRVQMLKLLDMQAKDEELFRNYFGCCQSVLSLLQIETPSAAIIKSWCGAEPVALDDVLPIPEDHQDWLGVKEAKRRSPESTAKTVRQQPSSLNLG